MEEILRSVFSEIGVPLDLHPQKKGQPQSGTELMRIKYFNGKEFRFLKTPHEGQESISMSSNFATNKKLVKRKLKKEQIRQKKIVEELSKGLNLLEWMQTGNIKEKKDRQFPVNINFPLGVQKIRFEGNLKGISLDGQGSYSWLDGCLEYKGEIKKGLRHGRGVLSLKDPFLFFKGNFVEGLKEGKGFLLFTSQNIFKGFFKRGLKHGFGIMAYAPEGTFQLTQSNIVEESFNGKNTRKRRPKKFSNFFKPQVRKSVGSNLGCLEQKKATDLMQDVLTLANAMTMDRLDDQNELKGIILGVKKKDYLNRKWCDGMVLKDGSYLDFKDQVLKDGWKHDMYVGNWRWA